MYALVSDFFRHLVFYPVIKISSQKYVVFRNYHAMYLYLSIPIVLKVDL